MGEYLDQFVSRNEAQNKSWVLIDKWEEGGIGPYMDYSAYTFKVILTVWLYIFLYILTHTNNNKNLPFKIIIKNKIHIVRLFNSILFKWQ